MKPSIIVVDDFYAEPNKVRDYARQLQYSADNRFYKGLRCPILDQDHLGARLAVGQLLGLHAVDWYSCYQKTTSADPLVYHSDNQKWAGAVYLTETRVDAGTSFWRDRKYGLRRPSSSPLINSEIYATPNLTSPDTWELVDRIGSVYNRLVLWRADLIHSATTYEGFTDDSPRLAQLMFFNG